MPTLSIVISAQGPAAALEQTLLSVLERRPADAEVLVVDHSGYADPYALAGEVHFHPLEATATLWDGYRLGIALARSPVVHLLAAGVEVADDWTQPALDLLRQPQIGLVAPTAHRRGTTGIVEATGIVYHAHGGFSIVADDEAEIAACLPCAGFYRRELFAEIGDFGRDFSSTAAAVNLGLRARAAGWRCLSTPASRVWIDAAAAPTSRQRYEYARDAERLFRIHAEHRGPLSTMVHAVAVGCECAGSAITGKGISHLFGRLAGWLSPRAPATAAESQTSIEHPPIADTAQNSSGPHAFGAVRRESPELYSR